MAPELATKRKEEEFLQSLTETIAWCSQHVSLDDPKHSLRIFSDDIPYLLGIDSFVSGVARRRHARLRHEGLNALSPVTDLQGGRLLFYMPDSTDVSGASKHETKGFFDVYDCPPFDTWVWYVSHTEDSANDTPHGYLIAWIPPLLLDLVSKGISVNPLECIGWLDTLNGPFTQSLRHLNLLF